MSVAVTGLYAGILGIVFIVLSMRVIKNPVRAKVNLLDGRDEATKESHASSEGTLF